MKKWFYFWVARSSGGQWFGPEYLTDREAFQLQLKIRTNTSDVEGIYRWFWMPPMTTWEYDTRPNSELISSDVRFSWL
jgi:hypothetical protein